MFDYVSYTVKCAPEPQHWVRLAHIATHSDALHLDSETRNKAARTARAILVNGSDPQALSRLLADCRRCGVQLEDVTRDESASMQSRAAADAPALEGKENADSEEDMVKEAGRLFRRGEVASGIVLLTQAIHEGRGISFVESVMRLCCLHLLTDDRCKAELLNIVSQIPHAMQPKANGNVTDGASESSSAKSATLYICLSAMVSFLNHDFATAAWHLSPTMLRHVGLQSASHLRSIIEQYISPPEEFALMIALSAIASLPRKEALEIVNSVAIRSLSYRAPEIHKLMADFSAFNLASVKALVESLSLRIVGDALLSRGWGALQPLLRSAIVLHAVQSFDAARTEFIADMVGMPVDVVEAEVANLISTKDVNVRIDSIAHTVRRREQLGVSSAALGKILSDGDLVISNTELALLSMSFSKNT